jgi:ABC-type dipeptide/oligopeptide/nickel transport system ATPase component
MTLENIVEVADLSVEFATARGPVRPVDGVSLSIAKGQVLGVVGEAGAGKTVLVRSLLRLLPEGGRVVSGSIRFNGRDILDLSDAELKSLRGTGIAHILPDAKSQLNPLLKIGDFMVAVVRTHAKSAKDQARERAIDLLRTVGITDPGRCLDAYPHELSGGMAQRVCIALALMHSPRVIIADEPTAGLDVTVQRQVLDLMAALVQERDAAQLIVTRDLGIVAHYCQWVAVMQKGRIVESASTLELFDSPQHPYTRELLSASRADRLTRSIRGAVSE